MTNSRVPSGSGLSRMKKRVRLLLLGGVMLFHLTGCPGLFSWSTTAPRTGGSGQAVWHAQNVFVPPAATPTPRVSPTPYVTPTPVVTPTPGVSPTPTSPVGFRAAESGGGTLYLVEPETGRLLFAREDEPQWEQVTPDGIDMRSTVTAVVQMPDGRTFLMATLSGISRSDLLSGTSAVASTKAATFMSCSPDGTSCFAVAPGSVAPGFQRSADGGATWQTSSSGLPTDSSPEAVASALFSPETGVCLVALADGRVYRSTDRGVSFADSPGLPQYSYPSGFAVSGASIYVSTNQGLFRSTDGGASFSAANGNLPGTNVLSVSAFKSTLYAALDVPDNPAASGLYRSRDGAATWSLVRASSRAATVTGTVSSPSAVYATTNSGLLRSKDEGTSWEPFSGGLVDCDTRALLVTDPAILQGTYGARSGVFRSGDGGTVWNPANPAMDGQFVTCLAASGTTILAGTESVASPSAGIFRSTDGGMTWTPSSGGLPISESSPISIYALAADGSTWIAVGAGGSGQSFIAFRSTDSGSTWAPVSSSLPSTSGAGLFSAAFVKQGGNQILLAGGNGGVFRSTDAGSSWSALIPIASSPNQIVSALSVHENSLFAAVTSPYGEPGVSGVWVSNDQGLTWESHGATFTGLSTRAVTSLAFSGSRVYAGTSGGVLWTSDQGATWQSAGGAQGYVTSLAISGDSLFVGVKGGGILKYGVSQTTWRLVPIVLDVSAGTAHYTTELAITNREAKPLTLTLKYTASLGEGSGTIPATIAAGQQLVIDDVIGYLRGKGLGIPTTGAQGGTLLVTFEGISKATLVSVTARTASQTSPPQPGGRAGLAYSALAPWEASLGALTVYGLRSNDTDRANLAVFSMSAEPVTVRVTAYSGARDGASQVIEEELTLPAFGWRQFDRVLEKAGMTTGWVTVARTSQTGTFSIYGVVNDNGTNDGSYLLPVGTVLPAQYLTIPVVLESETYRSELVLANRGTTEATFDLTYTESASPAGGTGGTVSVVLAPGEQRIIPEAIGFFRQAGAKIGAEGSATFVGLVHAAVQGVSLDRAYAGARSAARSPATGQFGLFTAPLLPGDESAIEAFIYGLRADEKSRSNVAVLNTGTGLAGAITLEVSAYDGDTGGTKTGDSWTVTLQPGQWAQQSNFLGNRGVENGWVQIRRTAGTGLWAAYGVINDGGVPRQKTDDGAFVPMTR